jgi:hypothetical protein
VERSGRTGELEVGTAMVLAVTGVASFMVAGRAGGLDRAEHDPDVDGWRNGSHRRSYQGETWMLDSPEDICAGQAWFEYPATFVLFSNP